MKIKTFTLCLITFIAFGCEKAVPTNSNLNSNRSANTAAANSANKLPPGAKIFFSGTSERVTMPCEGREVEVDADATAGKYILTGECGKITVDGVTNQVTVDRVGEIVVLGSSNTVTYGEGLNGKKPKITKTGVSAAVETMEEAKKQETENKK